ncbi:hypothetical protein FHU41_000250 [Psychromicrobium silvestre]|uniref:Uncharacterized protein n=1 Tax=Psychromicrobium silvestre TaxID=1645614 RepID=A0A7Y9LR24_9MICC|nr:hypothetical protein [Psychromicrobium silvestre]NYE94029.1 hypothetical protein [Psychromicrobium silvestre]
MTLLTEAVHAGQTPTFAVRTAGVAGGFGFADIYINIDGSLVYLSGRANPSFVNINLSFPLT